MENWTTTQEKGTTTFCQQNTINCYSTYYPYTNDYSVEVTVNARKTYGKPVDKQGYEGQLSPSSCSKKTLDSVLIQRKAASMQCDPPLITSVPGYLASVPPPPPDCSIKDELVQRQEEFIIECMYPKRILPNNVKLRDDNRPLSPSRIPGIKLTMKDIYGPERSPSSSRGCHFLKRRSPSPIRWRRMRSDSRDRYRSRSRSRSITKTSKTRLRSTSPFQRSSSPCLRSSSPRTKRTSPRSGTRLRSVASFRSRSPSPRLRIFGPKSRSPDSRNRSPNYRSRSLSPRVRTSNPRLKTSPRLMTPSPLLRSPGSAIQSVSPRLRSPSSQSEKSESSQDLDQQVKEEDSAGADSPINQKVSDKNKYQRSDTATPSK